MLSQSLSTITLLSFLSVLLPFSSSAPLDPTRLIYEFPNSTWVENLAVRSSGSILTTILSAPELYLINPFAPKPKAILVHNFPSGTGLLGITETTPDTFFVVVSNLTLSTIKVAPGSNTIFRVSFASQNATAAASVTHIATLPTAKLLNGLTTLNHRTILAADSGSGQVWSIDTDTGTAKVVIADPLMAPTSSTGIPSVGVNGIHLRGNNTLYFTNSAQALFAKIPINTDGTPQGPAVLLTRADTGFAYDDFALSPPTGDAFLTTSSENSIAEAPANGGAQTIVAGNLNSTEIAQPTSAAFGRTRWDKGVLYVGTTGGLSAPVNGHEIVGGQVVAVFTGDR